MEKQKIEIEKMVNSIYIKKNIKIIFSLIISYVGMMSCDENRIYDEYKSIEKATWNKDSIIDFEFTLEDTLSSNNIYIKVRNNSDYQYSNLYLFTQIKFPDEQILIDTLEYEMTDEAGYWLGTGFSDLKSNILFFKKNVIFYKKGFYSIKIQHGMRSELLEGIQDIGLRIEKR